MLALKDNCVHPETKQPYVKTGKGGKDNSPEGRQVSPPLPPADAMMIAWRRGSPCQANQDVSIRMASHMSSSANLRTRRIGSTT